MVRPGTQIVIKSAAPPTGSQSGTGTAFFAGVTPFGRTDKAVLVHNLDDFAATFGGRVSYSVLYDAVDAAFRSGVTDLYVGRVVGPAATKATFTFNDAGAAPSIAVDSIGAGTSTLSAAIVAGVGAGAFQIVITDSAQGNAVVEQSPDLLTPADAVSWATYTAATVAVRALGANPPAVRAASPLAGGSDDRASITDTIRVAALAALFPKRLGPGQVAYPGGTTAAVQAGLSDFCAQVQNRTALIDLADSGDPTALLASVAAWRAACTQPLSETYGMALGPWRVIPGLTNGTTRQVPPSAIVAGLIARNDGTNKNPNQPAAGVNGIDYVSLGSTQPDFTATQRQTLNNGGVNVFKTVGNTQRLYGFRSGANQQSLASNQWLSFAASRLRMAICDDLDGVGEQFDFQQIDGTGGTFARFHTATDGVLMRYWSEGALYGATPADAYVVDTGPTVNTPATIADQQLRVKIGMKDSPFAELSYFEVTKVAITEGL